MLTPWQEEASDHLTSVLKAQMCAIDLSDTGVGKTYTAAGTLLKLGSPEFLVVCPKAVIPSWQRVLEEYKLQPLGVLNPEALKTGKRKFATRTTIRSGFTRADGKKVKPTYRWGWQMPKGSFVIFDEAHRFSGEKTHACKLMAATRAYSLKTLCLSATIATSPMKMRALGYLLGLHGFNNFYDWCLQNGCYRNMAWGGISFLAPPQCNPFLENLHAQILPQSGVRLRVSTIPGFPKNEVSVEAYDLGSSATKEINDVYTEMLVKIEEDKELNPLVRLLRLRQAVEKAKLEFFYSTCVDLNAEHKAVVIFLSFRESVWFLMGRLDAAGYNPAVIVGQQSPSDRQQSIDDFQANRKHIVIATSGSGGAGISLHDLTGLWPRVSLINPQYSAVELKQTLGRIHRQGAMSPAVQKIIFAAKTVEEQACKAVQRKLNNLALLQDGDLVAGIL